jgi:predicted nucleic acid-binding protein
VRAFFDTNILVYAAQDGRKASIASGLIASGGVVSAQVLNEFVSVSRKKLKRRFDEVERALDAVKGSVSEILPLTGHTNAAAIRIARNHSLSFYDALIVASALEADCEVLWSEDMQHGRAFGALVILNPFLDEAA